MKKALSIALVVVMMLCLVLSVASCAKTLSGTYTLDLTVASTGAVTTFKFSGNEVTKIVETKVAGTVTSTDTLKGTYEITEKETGDLQITITYENQDPVTLDFVEAEDGSTIKIGLATYTKKA